MKLNNIPLKLDDRISDIEDIKTVITADENDVGKMGYFANSIHLFKNLEGLDGIKYGKYRVVIIMETVSDWLNRTEFTRFLKAKFYRIVDSNGTVLFDQLEARKYPPYWNVASILGMMVTNVEETKGYFIVTARRSEDV